MGLSKSWQNIHEYMQVDYSLVPNRRMVRIVGAGKLLSGGGSKNDQKWYREGNVLLSQIVMYLIYITKYKTITNTSYLIINFIY